MTSHGIQAIPYVPVFRYDAHDSIETIRTALSTTPQGSSLDLSLLEKDKLTGVLNSGDQKPGWTFRMQHGDYLFPDYRVLRPEDFLEQYLEMDIEEAANAAGRPKAREMVEAHRPNLGEVRPWRQLSKQ
jgi:hypothetical protein